MGLLKDTSVYLAGPVEHAQDATSWRDELTVFLTGMGIRVYDPMNPPDWAGYKKPDAVHIYNAYIGQSSRLSRSDAFALQRRVMAVCRRWAYACDWMICCLPKIFTIGTSDELTIVEACGKPVMLWMPDTISSSWAVNMVCRSEDDFDKAVFHNKEALVSAIQAIDSGKTPLDPLQWVFLKGEYYEVRS